MSTTPRPTKADRREEARQEALRLKAEQEAKARRQRVFAIGGVVALLALIGIAVAIIVGQSGGTSLSGVDAPQGSTESGGIPVGADGVAGTTSGSGEDAVTVAVYSDYMCPFCSLFEESNGATLDELREAGDIVVQYHPVSILDRYAEGTEFSTRASAAAAFVADNAPEQFVAFNTALFANQPGEGSPGLSDEEIADIARGADVPDEVAQGIVDGEHMTEYRDWVVAATEQASRDLGSLSTPTIVINGEKLDTAEYDWRQDGVLEQAIEDARG